MCVNEWSPPLKIEESTDSVLPKPRFDVSESGQITLTFVDRDGVTQRLRASEKKWLRILRSMIPPPPEEK